MAPKEKKRKAATKKTEKPEEQVMSEKRHNMIAYLDPEEKFTELEEITQWIRESRINKAVTFSTPVYKSLIKAFWNSASVVVVDGTEFIQGKVNEVNVNVSPDILNTVLELQDDPNAPYSIPIMCTCGCLLRMKSTGDIFSSQINKGDLPMRYKFLLHVLIQCLSNRRAGYENSDNDLMGLMVALVLNKPFSISKYILDNMKENMTRTDGRTTRNKFWMYPRFLQMIMNVQHPDLLKADDDILKIDTMIEHSLKIFKGLATKRYKESDPPRRLICALGKTDYIAPEDDKWRHNDSQSDDEEPELKKKTEQKFGRKDLDSSDSDDEGGDGGDAGALGASTAGASAAGTVGASSASDDEEDTESDDNQSETGYEFYVDERGVRQVRKIRREDDDDEYVPSDTKAERLKEKQTAARRKKKARKNIGSSSAQQSVPQQEPTQEAEMNPNLGFTTDEAVDMVASPPRSSEPTPVVTSAPKTPTVTPQELAPSIASTICATTSQLTSERR
ncbi:hypothetical protein HanXRQr2_Chr10g0463861 [Helianthus annuus]|uniref:Uncharacterized protein n=1 Tax=Helianthus annuus TaxID=4232 RepID=A0A9K3I1G9_HELAN|nr:hypothetical protein HanXRQr2_Chr10g0463861 [Helianthus annuus]KAJ0698495.1 hypothetical protein HanLR1_Chr10g0380571 [Helianthus annuus]KAJ0701843.1 hypothetical protein HanOQP8_Chr10g0383771 [Helianthus annuus]KAJ0885664.1 hypothetical protein HanPSC8_Chr10g0447671 [Helianthus annuus]